MPFWQIAFSVVFISLLSNHISLLILMRSCDDRRFYAFSGCFFGFAAKPSMLLFPGWASRLVFLPRTGGFFSYFQYGCLARQSWLDCLDLQRSWPSQGWGVLHPMKKADGLERDPRATSLVKVKIKGLNCFFPILLKNRFMNSHKKAAG